MNHIVTILEKNSEFKTFEQILSISKFIKDTSDMDIIVFSMIDDPNRKEEIEGLIKKIDDKILIKNFPIKVVANTELEWAKYFVYLMIARDYPYEDNVIVLDNDIWFQKDPSSIFSYLKSDKELALTCEMSNIEPEYLTEIINDKIIELKGFVDKSISVGYIQDRTAIIDKILKINELYNGLIENNIVAGSNLELINLSQKILRVLKTGKNKMVLPSDPVVLGKKDVTKMIINILFDFDNYRGDLFIFAAKSSKCTIESGKVKYLNTDVIGIKIDHDFPDFYFQTINIDKIVEFYHNNLLTNVQKIFIKNNLFTKNLKELLRYE